MKFGLEIELITDKQKFFDELDKHNIDYINLDKTICEAHDILVVKKEDTIKDPNGMELNFPPSENYELIKKVLEILNNLQVKFDAKCALHVHVDFSNRIKVDLDKLCDYYIEHQEEIIRAATKKGVYLNLNRTLERFEPVLPIKKFNMNIFNAFINHGTVEHRIYKSTIDFEEVKYCIEQTMQVVESAFK